MIESERRAHYLTRNVHPSKSVFGPVAKWGRLEFPLPDRAPEHGRDELAALIHGGTFSPPKDALEQIWRDKAYALADAIIAAGWRHQ